MEYKIFDSSDNELTPVDFYTRELHFDSQQIHIKPYNPLSEINEYEQCYQMYNANYQNFRYNGFEIDPNGNDSLVDVVDPDYKYPITATNGATSKIVTDGNTKLLEINPNKFEEYSVASVVKKLGRWRENSRNSRKYNAKFLSIVAFKLISNYNVEYYGSIPNRYVAGNQHINSTFIGGRTNTTSGFNPQQHINFDLGNKYLVFFRLGHVGNGRTHLYIYDGAGVELFNINHESSIYDLFAFYLKTEYKISLLEYSTFDYNNTTYNRTSSLEIHKERIKNLIQI